MNNCTRDNIIQYHRESNNCFQDVLGMILVNNNLNPLSMYIGCFNFGYKKDGRLFGERITPSRDGMWLDCTIFDSVFETAGMVLQKKEQQSYKDLLNDLRESKQGLILEVDVFDCEWHAFFKKVHSLHYCWLIGVEGRAFICALPYGRKIGIYRADLRLQYNYYTCSFIQNNKKPDCFNVLFKTYGQCMCCDNKITDLQQMYMFRNDVLKNKIDLQAEREGYSEIINIPIVRALEWVLWSRINYQDMLIYYDGKGIYKNITLELKKVIEIWKGIKNFIIIEFMREHKTVNEIIIKYLDEMIAQETVILKKMETVVLNSVD